MVLVKHSRPYPRAAGSAGPGQGWRVCSSNKLPGDADAASLGTTEPHALGLPSPATCSTCLPTERGGFSGFHPSGDGLTSISVSSKPFGGQMDNEEGEEIRDTKRAELSKS